MKYDFLFFDADDTLFDFKKSEKVSFKLVLEKHGIHHGHSPLQESYKKINTHLWDQHARGKVSQDFLKVERFKRLIEENRLDADPAKVAQDYLHALPDNVFLIEGASDLLQTLHQKLPLVIITNGIGETQHKRLHNSGIKPFIKLMVISEECGYTKPDTRIFEYTFSALKSSRHSARALMIGDKLETDILGANNTNLDSCWFNPEKERNNTSIVPSYEIQKLSELLKLI